MERVTPICNHDVTSKAARRLRRTIVGSVGAAALFLAGAVGCTGWSADSCDQYLLCVSATMPLAQTEQLALYGKDGSCWKQIEPEQCAKACKAGLRALAQTSTAKECHPSTSSNPDNNPDDPPAQAFSWSLPIKTMFYAGAMEDPKLSGEDPVTGDWLCTRDDKNITPPDSVRRMGEPNELPEQAIALPSPLPIDPPSSGANYEICADRAAPALADFDVYKFKVLSTPARVITEIKYQVKYGDLDIALFRDDPGPSAHNMTLIGANVTAKDNACVERDLPPGTYYLVVYGARDMIMQTKTAMNRYQLRVFHDQAASYTCP